MKKQDQHNIKGYQPFFYYVRTTDAKRYAQLYNQISSLIKNGKEVPMESLQEYFSLFEHESIIQIEKEAELSSKVVAKTYFFFQSRKGYDFNGKSRIKVEPIPGFHETGGFDYHYYTFEDIIRTMVNNYFKQKRAGFKPLETKDGTIQFLYQCLAHIKNTVFNHKHRKALSPYAHAAIVGYITHELGFMLTNRKPLSPEILQDAAKNAIRKLNIK